MDSRHYRVELATRQKNASESDVASGRYHMYACLAPTIDMKWSLNNPSNKFYCFSVSLYYSTFSPLISYKYLPLLYSNVKGYCTNWIHYQTYIVATQIITQKNHTLNWDKVGEFGKLWTLHQYFIRQYFTHQLFHSRYLLKYKALNASSAQSLA